MLQQWIDCKRQDEYFAVRNCPHPYEMSLCFDVWTILALGGATARNAVETRN